MSVSGSMMVAMMVSVRITSPTSACSSARRMEYCEMYVSRVLAAPAL